MVQCSQLIRLRWTVLVIAIVGTVIWHIFPNVSGDSSKWRQLPNPPEKATSFSGYSWMTGEIYVQGSTNNLYVCDDSCVLETHPIRDDPEAYSCGSEEIFPTPPPPGIVVDAFQACPIVDDGFQQENYVILENGTIWTWANGTYEYMALIVIFFVLRAILIGLGIGLVCVVIMEIIWRLVY